MNKPIITLSLFSVALWGALQGCVDHNFGQPFEVDCSDTETISYSQDVVPIINTKCALSGCHDGLSGIPDWTQLGNLQDRGSEVQRRITLPLTDGSKMPRVGSITEEQRQILYCWIEQGAQDN